MPADINGLTKLSKREAEIAILVSRGEHARDPEDAPVLQSRFYGPDVELYRRVQKTRHGMRTNAIARYLGMNLQTLKNHLHAIHQKTGTDDLVQLGILVATWKIKASGRSMYPVEEWVL